MLFTGVLPGWAHLLALDGIVETAEMYADIYPDTAEARADPFATIYDPASIPIASDGTGSTLFVNTRSGHVFGFMREDGETDGAIWDSVESMLNEIADALARSRPTGGWQPAVEDGVVTWEPADAEA
jgi:hypothetical protein